MLLLKYKNCLARMKNELFFNSYPGSCLFEKKVFINSSMYHLQNIISFNFFILVGEPEIQKLEKSGRKVAEF